MDQTLTSIPVENQEVEEKEVIRKAHLTVNSENINRYKAIMDVVRSMLYDEDEEDLSFEEIKDDLEIALLNRNCEFTTNYEKEDILSKYPITIERFIKSERTDDRRQNKRFISYSTNMEVEIDGEIVKAPGDYFVVDEEHQKVELVKIKTGTVDQKYISHKDLLAMKMVLEREYPGYTSNLRFVGLKYSSTYEERKFYETDTDKISSSYINEFLNEVEHYVHGRNVYYNDTPLYLLRHQYQDEEELKDKEESNDDPFTLIDNYIPAPVAQNLEAHVNSDVHLTPEQEQIINADDKFSRVIAGPGSGKTMIIAKHAVHLIKDKGVSPEDILLITYTKTGAQEMKARICKYAAEEGIVIDPDRFQVATINAFCQSILNEHYEELGYTKRPVPIQESLHLKFICEDILDRFDKISGWKIVSPKEAANIKVYNTNTSKIAHIQLSKYIKEINKNGYTIINNPYRNDEYKHEFKTEADIQTLFRMVDEYNRICKEKAYIDFDDQLTLVLKLYEQNPNIFKDNYPFKTVIVDEAQDTNQEQWDLVKALTDTQDNEHNLFCGDPEQSIYGFRGTDSEIFNSLQNVFPGLVNYDLLLCHRCSGEVVDFVNKTVEVDDSNTVKKLVKARTQGKKPLACGYYTKNQELTSIADMIKHDWDTGNRDSIAFLAREGKTLQKMAGLLAERGVPSILMNPTPYQENSRVIALMHFFDSYTSGTTAGCALYKNVLLNGRLKDIPRKEVQDIAESFLEELKDESHSVTNFLSYAKLLDEAKTDEVYQAFIETNIVPCRDMDDLKEFMDSFKVYGTKSAYRKEGIYNDVNLITIHSSKGAEYDTVYLCTDGLDRANSRTLDPENIRLWYVGASRAKNNLILAGLYYKSIKGNDASFNRITEMNHRFTDKPFCPQVSMVAQVKLQEEMEKLQAKMQLKQKIELSKQADKSKTKKTRAKEVESIIAETSYQNPFISSPVNQSANERAEEIASQAQAAEEIQQNDGIMLF